MEIVLTEALARRVRPVRLLLMDVDGVMTDGRIVYNDRAEESKSFDVQDGHGIKLLMRAGIDAGIITSRQSQVVIHRASNLGMGLVYQGAVEKIKAFEEILERKRLAPEEVAYIGDDIVDLPVLASVGFAIGVPNAVDEVKDRVHYVTRNSGGRGAIREVVEIILKTQGRWQEILKRYL